MIHTDFQHLIHQAGSEDGARILFQRLISALVSLLHKDAREIRPAPGDWGIDVIAGSITGYCLIWQAKFFIDGVSESQQSQIRDSFSQLVNKAKEQHIEVRAWTLCIPCNLSGPEEQWWEKWKSRKSKEYSITIELWDESTIRRYLDSPDAQLIKAGYFGENPTILNYFLEAMKGQQEREIKELPEPSSYEDSLFVRKLQAGGISEIQSAKTQFFNAELLVQEVQDKGDPAEVSAVISLREKLRSIWETRYNEACSGQGISFSSLYPSVMKAVEDKDKSSLTTSIQATFIHKQGMIHQLADRCHVGWIKNYKDNSTNG
jgi:hypothetical protein